MAIQQEMLTVYREHRLIHLIWDVLPIVIQMPIIMGLYFAILYSEDVKAMSFYGLI